MFTQTWQAYSCKIFLALLLNTKENKLDMQQEYFDWTRKIQKIFGYY